MALGLGVLPYAVAASRVVRDHERARRYAPLRHRCRASSSTQEVTHVDSTRLEALEQLTRDLRRDGITLVVARLRTRMEEPFELAGVTETIGRQLFYPSVRAAVEACVQRTERA
jgi:MFS superfamily sulfate permease-like transporter